MTLTTKQERFVEEYLIDANATQAAIRAGYSEKTAFKIGSENLINLRLQSALLRPRIEPTVLGGERLQRIPFCVANAVDQSQDLITPPLIGVTQSPAQI